MRLHGQKNVPREKRGNQMKDHRHELAQAPYSHRLGLLHGPMPGRRGQSWRRRGSWRRGHPWRRRRSHCSPRTSRCIHRFKPHRLPRARWRGSLLRLHLAGPQVGRRACCRGRARRCGRSWRTRRCAHPRLPWRLGPRSRRWRRHRQQHHLRLLHRPLPLLPVLQPTQQPLLILP